MSRIPVGKIATGLLSAFLCACGSDGAAPIAAQAPAPAPAPGITVNCAAFIVTGETTSTTGARWTYQSTDAGVEFNLSGVLFEPAAPGPHAAVVVSHGYGGSAYGYSTNVARAMRDWGLVAIATNYTHAPDNIDAGLAPQGGDGASDANVARARKTRGLLACIDGVDLTRVAAHGHSMGAFVTGQLLGSYPGELLVASHSAGGANDTGPNATRASVAALIRTPYQLHHGDADIVVNIGLDRALAGILNASGTAYDLVEYPGYTHEQIALDPTMLTRVHDWYRAYGLF